MCLFLLIILLCTYLIIRLCKQDHYIAPLPTDDTRLVRKQLATGKLPKWLADELFDDSYLGSEYYAKKRPRIGSQFQVEIPLESRPAP